MATTNGISLAPDNLEEEVAQLMSQDLPYTVFDTDTEVAVASVLNAKLEFDETLLTENVVLTCGAQGERGELEGVVQAVEMQENSQEKDDSEDDESSHYTKRTRTVVCEASSSTEVSGLPSTHLISQLDGADSGSESEENDEVDGEAHTTESGESQGHSNHNTPPKQLSVALKRLESVHSVSTSTVEQGTAETTFQGSSSPSAVLEAFDSNSDVLVQEEEVLVDSETTEKVFLDSATGHFVSADDGTIVNLTDNVVAVKDDSDSSTESVEGFKDDFKDPDYTPEPKTPKSPTAQTKTIIVKPKYPTPKIKVLFPKPCLQQQRKIKLLLPPQPSQAVNNVPVSTAAATFSAVPRTVTSPIIINGLNALSVQPSATRGKAVAIRLNNSRPVIQQQLVVQNRAVASNTDPPQTPAPQVLLVNRQGQILIKDPRSNTYQTLSTNSPTYSRISQIAKILHSGNALQRSVARVPVKPHSSPSDTNVPAASNHTTTTPNKIIVRVVPVKHSASPTPSAPVSVQNVAEGRFSNLEESTSQAIISKAMASQHDTAKTTPIILNSTRGQKARHRRASLLQDTEHPEQSNTAGSESPSGRLSVPVGNLPPTPAASGRQVRMKRVSSVSQRPSRKRSKMDFLRDPSSEPNEVNDSRYAIFSN